MGHAFKTVGKTYVAVSAIKIDEIPGLDEHSKGLLRKYLSKIPTIKIIHCEHCYFCNEHNGVCRCMREATIVPASGHCNFALPKEI